MVMGVNYPVIWIKFSLMGWNQVGLESVYMQELNLPSTNDYFARE